MRRLPDALAGTNADVLCLQEVWSPDLRHRLTQALATRGYAYHAGTEPISSTGLPPLGLFRGFFGNGLLTVSRYPLLRFRDELAFRYFTRPDEILVRKGALAVEIMLPGEQRVIACNAHLGAVSYSTRTGRYQARHVLNRLRQTASLVRWLRKLGTDSPLFLAADLNVHYQAWALRQHSNELSREVALLLGRRTGGHPLREVSLELGAHKPMPQWTFHCQNPYVASGFFGHLPNEVTDYLFYRPGLGWRPSSVQRVLVPEDPPSLEPGRAPLSDHFGILAEFHRDAREAD